MSLNLGDTAPNFTADTTHGMINFYEWMNNCWTIFLSHPKDFTPVCTTELLWISENNKEFENRNVKVISLSVEKLIQYSKWLDDVKNVYNININIPIISDKNMRIAKLYSMIGNNNKLASVDTNVTSRAVYIISPDKKISAKLFYPVNSGRNFKEILRVMDSLLITNKNDVATPVNWIPGENCVIPNRDIKNEIMLGYPKEISINRKSSNGYHAEEVMESNMAC